MTLQVMISASIIGCLGIITEPLLYLINSFLSAKESFEERKYSQDIIRLKRNLQSISMADEFAKWARINRQLTQLTENYQNKVTERQSVSQKRSSLSSIVVQVVFFLITVSFVWSSYGVSVAQFEPSLLTPLSFLLSIPGCSSGQISVMFWLSCVRVACSRLQIYLPFRSQTQSGGLVTTLTSLFS